MSAVNHLKARVGALSRSRPADDPELVEARRELAAERISKYVRQTVASFPPLTPEQSDRISVILRGGAA